MRHTLISISKTNPMSTQELIHAYRRLLRAGLRAVQFSQPSKSTITRLLREGFRDPKGIFEPRAIRNTVYFLNGAAAKRGLEHRILKILCRVHWDRMREMGRTPWKVTLRLAEAREKAEAKGKGKSVFFSFSFLVFLVCSMGCADGEKREPDVIKGTEHEHFDRTIAMLNATMGTCLR